MHFLVLIWQRSDYVIAIQAFPKIYFNLKKSGFEAKNESIFAVIISIYDRIYAS